ncbi:MAG TPA: HAD family hydrolase [Acidimicrobiales bacterium]|nr:HAD family hydrolase [Acidimicrobiales bacterium]
MTAVIGAIVFDLDDTLYDQQHWLAGAWRAVARAAAQQGLPEDSVHAALVAVAAEGSDRGRIIERALETIKAEAVDIPVLVDAFRTHTGVVSPFAGVRAGLAELRHRLPIGLVSDGDPAIQRAKLAALGLDDAFDAVVWSDELGGRAFRKPHSAPFARVLELLGAAGAATVFVGDRPDKDGLGAARAGMRYLRVLTGEYRTARDATTPWRTRRDIGAAIDMLKRMTTAPIANAPALLEEDGGADAGGATAAASFTTGAAVGGAARIPVAADSSSTS